jgi:putative transposase
MALTSKIREQPHRLNLSQYLGLVRASFTICIQNRLPVFIEPSIVNKFAEILRISCKKHFCLNWAYVFMPDHVHIVIEGREERSNLWKTIVLFKQRTGYWFLKNMPKIHWQKDFYDHIYRNENELINNILYIANNPVRKNLVMHWQDYTFTGSLDNDLSTIICG